MHTLRALRCVRDATRQMSTSCRALPRTVLHGANAATAATFGWTALSSLIVSPTSCFEGTDDRAHASESYTANIRTARATSNGSTTAERRCARERSARRAPLPGYPSARIRATREAGSGCAQGPFERRGHASAAPIRKRQHPYPLLTAHCLRCPIGTSEKQQQRRDYEGTARIDVDRQYSGSCTATNVHASSEAEFLHTPSGCCLSRGQRGNAGREA